MQQIEHYRNPHTVTRCQPTDIYWGSPLRKYILFKFLKNKQIFNSVSFWELLSLFMMKSKELVVSRTAYKSHMHSGIWLWIELSPLFFDRALQSSREFAKKKRLSNNAAKKNCKWLTVVDRDRLIWGSFFLTNNFLFTTSILCNLCFCKYYLVSNLVA